MSCTVSNSLLNQYSTQACIHPLLLASVTHRQLPQNLVDLLIGYKNLSAKTCPIANPLNSLLLICSYLKLNAFSNWILYRPLFWLILMHLSEKLIHRYCGRLCLYLCSTTDFGMQLRQNLSCADKNLTTEVLRKMVDSEQTLVKKSGLDTSSLINER